VEAVDEVIMDVSIFIPDWCEDESDEPEAPEVFMDELDKERLFQQDADDFMAGRFEDVYALSQLNSDCWELDALLAG